MALRQQRRFLRHVEELSTLLVPENYFPLHSLPDGYFIVRRDAFEDGQRTYDVAVQFAGERPDFSRDISQVNHASSVFYAVPLHSFLMDYHSLPEHLRMVFSQGYGRQLVRLPFRRHPSLYDVFLDRNLDLTIAVQEYYHAQQGNDEDSFRLERIIGCSREQFRLLGER